MFQFTHEQFSGPLDLLLQLVQENKLKITEVSLAQVTDRYVAYVQNSGQIDEVEIADFLLLAARLLYLKSRELLPQILPEDSGDDLERQLKMYEQFVRAAADLQEILSRRQFMYPRDPLTVRSTGFQPPRAVTAEKIYTVFRDWRERWQTPPLPEVHIEKIKSLHERVNEVQALLQKLRATEFHKIADQESRADIIVTFLALLELVKQRSVNLTQNEQFGSIQINAHAL